MSTITDQNQEPEQLLSIGQASEYLGISIDTLRRWERKGRIEPFRSPGGHRYYKKSFLDSLFGKRYTRDEPTIRSGSTSEPDEPRSGVPAPETVSSEEISQEEETKEPEIKIGLPSWRAIREEIIIEETADRKTAKETSSENFQIEPLDRPVREVQIPQPVRIEVIKRDLLLTPEEAYLRQQSISVLEPSDNKDEEKTETLIPFSTTPEKADDQKKEAPKKDEVQNKKMIIVSSIFAVAILLSIVWYFAWSASQRVLSPVP